MTNPDHQPAQAMSARSGETAGLAPQDASAVPERHAPETTASPDPKGPHMTAASNEVVAVIQADVDAANALDYALGFLTDNERPIVLQALARHRIAHSDPRPVAEGLREALELLRDDVADPYSFSGDGDDQGQCITQHKFFRWGDDCVIAIGELNYPNQWDDEAFDAKVEVLKAALATHSPAPMAGETAPLYTFDEAWDELVNKDDRTSPEEYPDMCLITRDELQCYMEARQYAPAAAHPSTQEGGK